MPTAARARRGRPRSFDVDAATGAALRVLWRRGYDATSIDDLVAATGLSPSSLYGTFGSKRGLFQAALDRYDRHVDAVLGPLAGGAGGVDDVTAFLARIRRLVAVPHSPGCFMVNTMNEMSPRDPDIAERTHRFQLRVRSSVGAALARAAARQEIEPDTVEDRAHLVQGGVFGALVAARSGAGDEAVATIDALEHEVRRWTPCAPGASR